MATSWTPNEGKLFLFEMWANSIESNDYQVILYQNDVAEDDAVVLSDLVECDFDGYTRTPLDSLVPAFLDDDAKAHVFSNTKSWTKGVGGTSNTVYGAAVIHAVEPELIIRVFPFDAPVDMGPDGAPLSFTLHFTLRNEQECP